MNEDRGIGDGAMLSDIWCLACGTPYWGRPCTTCGGNVARAERLKRELGTKIIYFHAASRIEGYARANLGTSLVIELHNRFRGARPPKALRDWASREEEYCLDAPEEMPAGGCFREELPWAADEGDPEVPFVVSQLTTRREPEVVSPSEPRELDILPP